MKGLFLTDEPVPMKKYIFLMAIISLIPSIMLGTLVTMSGLFDQVGPNLETDMPVLEIVIGIMIISPIIETLMMSFLFFLLSFFVKSKLKLAIISAILWAGLHSLFSPGWGLIVWWPFFVFSCAYLTWRNNSWLKAIWVTTCIHFLQNLIPSIVMLFTM